MRALLRDIGFLVLVTLAISGIGAAVAEALTHLLGFDIPAIR